MKKRVLTVAATVLLLVIAGFWLLGHRDLQSGEAPEGAAPVAQSTFERGRALVVLGDCQACHTARGGEAFAGDRPVPTPFGTFYSPNITPDVETGIGKWSADDFWRAIHNGRSRNGRPLYPVFPYTSYTKVSRADSDAMFEYLRSIKPTRRVTREHELAFPYNQRLLLAGWRWLYFRPGVYQPDPEQSPEWNRGAYLVQGVAHCGACHEARNALGATRSAGNASGGLVLNWYSPALGQPEEAGVQAWDEAEIVALLKTGRTAHASTLGPMAEVVYESLQHASAADLQAMAVYLKSLPAGAGQAPQERRRRFTGDATAMLERGRKTYADECARCHGDEGEGRPPAALGLASNRAITLPSAVNAIRVVLYGGYPPGTTGNPRPFGMPPFSASLDDRQIAEVLSYIRTSWGNQAGYVTADEVALGRTGPLW